MNKLMDKLAEAAQSFVMIAGMLVALAALIVMPALADDAQSVQSREPFYVGEGDRLDSQRTPGQGADALQPVQFGNLRYITGGIGDEERDALDSVKNDYNLHVINSNTAGEFNGDTQITIFDARGDQLVNANAGPLFYANLPRGAYIVEVSNDGHMQKRKVAVGEGKSPTVYFRW